MKIHTDLDFLLLYCLSTTDFKYKINILRVQKTVIKMRTSQSIMLEQLNLENTHVHL